MEGSTDLPGKETRKKFCWRTGGARGIEESAVRDRWNWKALGVGRMETKYSGYFLKSMKVTVMRTPGYVGFGKSELPNFCSQPRLPIVELLTKGET